MTLGRQLVITISLMFLAMLMGVELIYLEGARRNLQNQLESHAQDAATSLGLSLGILLGRGDDPIAETAINAVFDRGNYERIEFVTLEGKRVANKVLDHRPQYRYPDWFSALYPLNGPTAESLVSTGWRQLGKVRVTSHPRFAYEQLWDTVRDTMLWLLVIYLLALAFLMLLLRSILRPLKAIEVAADAIANRQFVTVDDRPTTRELARVVAAMNSLSGKVRAAFEAETARATALQEAAYMDPLTGILNRRGFSEHFDSQFRYDKESFVGTVALVQVTRLAQINETFGQERGDDLVRSVGELVDSAARSAGGFAGRWAGATFALAIPGGARGPVEALLSDVRANVKSRVAQLGLGADIDTLIAAVRIAALSPDLASLVAAADSLLQRAIIKGADRPESEAVFIEDRTDAREDDLESVKIAIASGNVQLVSQAAHSVSTGEILHLEIMGRLLDSSGKALAAADFIPLVVRHGLSRELDQAVLNEVAKQARHRQKMVPLSVNLSAAALADREFTEWLEQLLTRDLLSTLKLVFEISEHGAFQNEAATASFASHVSSLGAALAIDHFGVHRESLALLRRIKPAYVKLSAVHTSRLASDSGTRFFIESIVRAAAQLDVPVIAQNVETTEAVATLKELGLSGYQGFVSGKPAPWPPAS